MENMKDKIIAAYEEMAGHYHRLIDHKPYNAYHDRPNTLSLIPEPAGQGIKYVSSDLSL
jgi:hypothetical protein